LLVVGFLRLAFQWHMTFCVNSVAHCLGRRPYSNKTSARDSFVTAILTLGEGYHNFHHHFPRDYRNGHRWYHFDPTKWTVFVLSKLGLARALKRTPVAAIREARERVTQQNLEGRAVRRMAS
jgi:stearoyl-CoA desaturase (delta-9 desaturase)